MISNIHNFSFTTNELSIILTVIKRKSVLNFYNAFCNTFKPNPLTMDYFAGRSQQYDNDSLSSFLERQKVNLRTQIIKYDEKVRKYNTVLVILIIFMDRIVILLNIVSLYVYVI